MTQAPFQPGMALSEFFDAFGVSRADDFDADQIQVIELCKSLIREEATEVREALHAMTLDGAEREAKAALAKELADLVYVAFYAAEALQIPLEWIFRDVHGSNMSKLENGKPVRRADGKVLKGKNYRAPDLKKYF